MPNQQITRRLAAVLAADVAGYSSMMELDEGATLGALRQIWTDTFIPSVAAHHGRIVKMMGDGALVEFASVVEAVECAVAIQEAMDERNSAAERRVDFRMGINLGEIVIEGDDIFGEGVIVASRLEAHAPERGILVSDAVHNQIRGKVGVTFVDTGEVRLKNLKQPLRVWRWDGPAVASAANHILAFAKPAADKPSIAVLPFVVMGSDPEQEFFAESKPAFVPRANSSRPQKSD